MNDANDDANKPACSRCQYWAKVPLAPDNSGECRIKPPVLVPAPHGAATAFPRTLPSTWCGSFLREIRAIRPHVPARLD